jgi:hypothetical protein
MNGYEIFLLVLFFPSLLGGYLATGKKSQQHEDVGHSLILVLGVVAIFGICWPGVTLAWYEKVALFLDIFGGFLLGVGLWRDTRALNSEQPKMRSSRNDP